MNNGKSTSPRGLLTPVAASAYRRAGRAIVTVERPGKPRYQYQVSPDATTPCLSGFSARSIRGIPPVSWLRGSIATCLWPKEEAAKT